MLPGQRSLQPAVVPSAPAKTWAPGLHSPPASRAAAGTRGTSPLGNSWGVTQLTDGWPDAFSELDVELDGSNSVFVGIRGLPPDSPSFCPHPR